MPRLNKRRLQVANKKRNTDGCFSKLQEQQQESIENNDDGQVHNSENREILIWSAEDFQEFKDVEKRFELAVY